MAYTVEGVAWSGENGKRPNSRSAAGTRQFASRRCTAWAGRKFRNVDCGVEGEHLDAKQGVESPPVNGSCSTWAGCHRAPAHLLFPPPCGVSTKEPENSI